MTSTPKWIRRALFAGALVASGLAIGPAPVQAAKPSPIPGCQWAYMPFKGWILICPPKPPSKPGGGGGGYYEAYRTVVHSDPWND